MISPWDRIKEQTQVNLIKSFVMPTDAIIAAELATAALWKMRGEAIKDGSTNEMNYRAIAHEAMECESTCRKMWQELYDKRETENG
jgi:hypothetical protein